MCLNMCPTTPNIAICKSNLGQVDLKYHIYPQNIPHTVQMSSGSQIYPKSPKYPTHFR